MKRKLCVLQEDSNDCACACISSIIKYYDGYLDMESIREVINTTRDGTNALDIVNGVSLIGLSAYGEYISFNKIKDIKKSIPVIAYVKKNNLKHFIVIYKISDNYILVMDPSKGFIKYKYNEFESIYLGVILFFQKVKEIPKIEHKNYLFYIIRDGLKNNKRYIVLILVMTILIFILSFSDIIFYKIVIDNIVNSRSLLMKFALCFIVIIFIKNILIYLRNILTMILGYNFDKYTMSEVLDFIFCLPYSYYKSKSTGEVLSRINDMNLIKDLILTFVLNTFVNIFLILILIIIMFMNNYKFTILLIILIIINLLIILLFHKKLDNSIKLVQESKGMFNQELIDNISGVQSISNLGISNIRKDKLVKSFLNHKNNEKHIQHLYIISNLLKFLVNDIWNIIFLMLGGLSYYNSLITLGDIVLYYMVYSFIISFIRELLDKELDIIYILKNIEKVNGLLKFKNISYEETEISGNIEIKDLSFSYGIREILTKENLIINEEDKILIDGDSGSGKSTLLKIILKYYNLYKGEIYIGGVNLKDISYNSIRKVFTYVGQNEKMFRGSIKENILIGREIKECEYLKVIKICELEDLINSNKFKDKIFIEDDGFNISGGERERIVLARALLKESKYILIDEALSEVNTDLEIKILKNIFKEYKDKTIIYVTHKEEVKKLFSNIYSVRKEK